METLLGQATLSILIFSYFDEGSTLKGTNAQTVLGKFFPVREDLFSKEVGCARSKQKVAKLALQKHPYSNILENLPSKIENFHIKKF